MISVIICTYKRAETLKEVLDSLKHQSNTDFELLIVDGSGDDTKPYEAVKEFENKNTLNFPVRFIKSEKGLTKQRNNGLKEAKGDIIAFFDDDVTFESDFLARIDTKFKEDIKNELSGITGYDIKNYPAPISSKLKLRKRLGIIPSLIPGEADHLGRHVPLSILQPTEKDVPIGWMSGFCMIYKAEKIRDLKFDEKLPTYGGEDRDFSLSASTKGKLQLCGSLKISHNTSTENRANDVRRVWETNFGIARSFAKRKQKGSDKITFISFCLGELLIDIIAFITSPSSYNFKSIYIKPNGFIKGLRSIK